MIICFSKYSKIKINLLSLLICCLIFFVSAFISKTIFSHFNSNDSQEDISLVDVSQDEDLEESDDLVQEERIQYDWYLEIPRINLYAEISAGTDDETLNKYIGHFDESKMESGNVCLAAHNRGYDVNYFARVKELEEGDKIIYFVNGNEYEYIVDEILVVYETDWTVIENTEEDRITLITCIENRDAYRLCVRGIREE